MPFLVPRLFRHFAVSRPITFSVLQMQINKKYLILNIAVVFVLIVLLGVSINSCNDNKAESDRFKELLQNVPKPPDMTEVTNEVIRLKSLNKELKDSVTYLESRGQEVKYITRTVTKLEGAEVSYKTLPASYQYKLNDAIPIASFDVVNDEYKFTSYDLQFNTAQVQSEDSTLVKVSVISSFDGKEYLLPVEAKVMVAKPFMKDFKLFNPRFTLGLGVSYPLTGPEAVIGLPLLDSPKQNFSWLMPTVTISQVPKIGLTPFLYNVGKPIPLMDDLWLGLGYETDFVNHYGMLSLTSKL